jgi:hypothetical protein
MRKLILLAGSVALVAMLSLASIAGAAQIGHDHFTSDPYGDNWCGVEGTSIDYVVANYTLDGSRASINVKTIFTATTSGKSMEITQTGVRKASAPTDNGDGTYSVVFLNAGQSPRFKLPTGQVIQDTGLLEGVATFDAATDEFLSFEVVKLAGPRSNACDAIVAALT